MVLKKKNGKKKDEEVNQEGGLSLDEYLNSNKEYTVENMKETAELFLGKEVKGAMIMSKEENEYEDDYETESEPAANAVAGLSLSDYLTGPKKEKKKKKEDTSIEGMSLESYLGAVGNEDDTSKRLKQTQENKPKQIVLQVRKKSITGPLKTINGEVVLMGKKVEKNSSMQLTKKKQIGQKITKKLGEMDTSPTKHTSTNCDFDPLPKLMMNSKRNDWEIDESYDNDTESRLPPLPH
ncbi:hypothetical protein THRCLA_20499 [Thraustotheca clavata]|uniref:Uncharacterized protein n=1 Tax=Thraustotheca clavata TaxID=74557 RepID=A0A1W0A6U4_9STRA|nr:hypothetical protein THRCLA_20499 [Thraustotheca clavata]